MSDFLEGFPDVFSQLSEGFDGALDSLRNLADVTHLTHAPDPGDLTVQVIKLQNMINGLFDAWGTYWKEQANERLKARIESHNEYMEKQRDEFEDEVKNMDIQKFEDDETIRTWVKEHPEDADRDVITILKMARIFVESFGKELDALKKEVDEVSEGFESETTEDIEEFDDSDKVLN